MKFLAVFFAVGFACASAIPLDSFTHDLESKIESDEIFDGVLLHAEEKKTLDEVQKELKERFEKVLQKIRDVINQGKEIKENSKLKLKELREKFAKLRDSLSEHDKEALGKLREIGRDFLKGLLEGLGFGKKAIDQHSEQIILAAEEDFDVTTLREKFQELVKRVKDAFEQGKSVNDALEKLQILRETLKLLNIDLGEKGREYLELLKEKVKDYFRKLKEKWTSKRSADIDVFGMLEELKRQIKGSSFLNEMKEILEKFFGKGGELKEHLMKLLKENDGKQRIVDLINRVLGKRDERRSISEVYDKIKDFFKDLNLELKERLAKFGEWVKEKYEKGLEKGKTKAENVKKIAKEFLRDTQNISKNMAREALEFFTDYRNDLGDIYKELVDKIAEILKS